VIEVRRTSSRRFIYLADIVRKAIKQSCDNLVIIRTSWVKELAEAEDDFIPGARAIDRVLLRFGAVHVVQPQAFTKAITKMGTLQTPRDDVILYDGLKTTLTKAVDKVREMRETQIELGLDPTVNNLSGHIRGRCVLVGEKINPYLQFSHWPWFDDHDSAAYISKALEEANIVEQDLLWTNAVHPNEGLIVQALMAKKPSLRVVAMGNVAHEKLDALGIGHFRVTHPQHARRFDYHGGYSATLEQAIRG
jgi:hypothetical protein